MLNPAGWCLANIGCADLPPQLLCPAVCCIFVCTASSAHLAPSCSAGSAKTGRHLQLGTRVVMHNVPPPALALSAPSVC